VKIKFAFLIITISALASVAFAQAVKVTPLKTVYQRAVKKDFAHKKTFVITRPKVSGLSAILNRKIEKAISFERVFDFNLKEEQTEIFWLAEAGYKTEFNRDGILAVALTMDGSGAYPSIYTKHVVVDVKTGLPVKPEDVFSASKTVELVRQLNERLQEAMKLAISEAKKDSAEDGAMVTEMLAEKKFETEHLSHFTASEKGVTFYYDYGFPHVALALEPNGEFFLSYADLKSFIRPDGLLGKFVRYYTEAYERKKNQSSRRQAGT